MRYRARIFVVAMNSTDAHLLLGLAYHSPRNAMGGRLKSKEATREGGETAVAVAEHWKWELSGGVYK